MFGRVNGVLIAFLLPFLDIGIAQSPMLRPEPAGWAQLLSGYGAIPVVIEGGLTAGFGQVASLASALARVLALLAVAVFTVDRLARPARG